MGSIANRPLGPVGAAQVLLEAAHKVEAGEILTGRTLNAVQQAIWDLTDAVVR